MKWFFMYWNDVFILASGIEDRTLSRKRIGLGVKRRERVDMVVILLV